MLSVVATDGYEVEPTPVESLIINPGERYDFILTANQTVGNYWVRCDSTEVRKHIPDVTEKHRDLK